jgi:ribosomal protein S18 acetylase RimI-like enzyme
MGSDAIAIERGLPDHLRSAGVSLFDDAFGDKMRMAIPDRSRRLAYMDRVYRGDHVVVAVRAGELLGMMALASAAGAYRGGLIDVPWDPRPFRDLLGLRGAMRATLGLRLAQHRPASDELYVDGVAVAAAARGQGIGSKLLAEAMSIAQEGGWRWLRLDVIDTNPRAQALYERLGYRVTKVERMGPLRRWTGFGAIISMERPVDAPGVATGA